MAFVFPGKKRSCSFVTLAKELVVFRKDTQLFLSWCLSHTLNPSRVEVFPKKRLELQWEGVKINRFHRKAPVYAARSAVKAVNICKICGFLLWILVRFALFSGKTFIFCAFTWFLTKRKIPYTGLYFSPHAIQQLLIPLLHLSLNLLMFHVNFNQVQ